MTSSDVVTRLGLERHPEGGWFRRTWASTETVTLADGRMRQTASMIWFFLPAGESSRWHRVASDEMWLGHDGSVTLELGGTGDAPAEVTSHVLTGADPVSSQLLVPAGVWQRALPAEADALVRCVVSPGFDFDDFEMLEG